MYKILSYIFLTISIFLTSGITFAIPETCIINADGTMPNATDFLQRCGAGTTGVSPSTASDKAGIRERVASIAEKAIGLGALFAIGFIVYAGIQYTTAYGDDEKLKHAKSTGIYAAIGLLFLMLAFGLVDIFIRFIYTFGG